MSNERTAEDTLPDDEAFEAEYNKGVVSLEETVNMDAEEVEAEDAGENVEEDAEEAEAEDTEDDVEDDAEEDTEDEEEELIEIDFGGEKFQISKKDLPPELAEKTQDFSKKLWGEYTRKSQEIAETKKSIQQEREQLEYLQGLRTTVLDGYAKASVIKNEIGLIEEAIRNNDGSDPALAGKLLMQHQELKRHLDQIATDVQQAEAQEQENQQLQRQQVAEKGREIVLNAVPTFEADFADVKKYVCENYGVTEQNADDWAISPYVAIMAHKAMRYDAMQERIAQKKREKQAAKKVEATQRSRRTANRKTKTADEMSPEEWYKYRKAQKAKASG